MDSIFIFCKPFNFGIVGQVFPFAFLQQITKMILKCQDCLDKEHTSTYNGQMFLYRLLIILTLLYAINQWAFYATIHCVFHNSTDYLLGKNGGQ